MDNDRTTTALKKAQSTELPLLVAKLGLAGHQLHKLNDGYLVYRLNLVKHCSGYAELVEFAKKVGVLK